MSGDDDEYDSPRSPLAPLLPGGAQPRLPPSVFDQIKNEFFTPAPGAPHEYIKRRSLHDPDSFGTHIMYCTGISFGTGMIAGSAYGAVQGWRKHINPSNFRLRMNAILNQTGRYGSQTANSLAIFAMFYSANRSILRSYRGKEKHGDIWNDVGGFAAAGALSALPKGLVASLTSSLIIGTVATGALYFKRSREAGQPAQQQ